MRNLSIKEKQYNLTNAIASVEIEGYTITKEEKELCMDVLNEKITKDEFIKILLERCTM
jgi:hypothetical protein